MFAIAGLAVVVAVFWKIGWPAIRANLLTIGPWFAVLVALNLAAQAAFVAGLKSVLRSDTPPPRFSRLYSIYLMGDAASYVAPASGDALKVHLLGTAVGVEAAAAAVTLHKQAELLAQCAFTVVGVCVALLRFELPRLVAWAAVLGVLVLVGLLVLMTWALASGAFSRIAARVAGWKFLASRSERIKSGA
ncbi:MAG TPA: lysylphosphatidylglycerol synthase domain-containing protein, partial [Thermoanaerobaculia bacterium]|nr:lysylphosphatidylglycerol synthase domain-containing protein [Thermoanaerobaculia bacterium]